MPISIGAIDIPDDGEIYAGTSAITEVYQGTTLIWPPEDLTPPPVVTTGPYQYVNSGPRFGRTTTVFTGAGSTNFVPTPDSEEFLREQTCRSVTTIITESQNQARICAFTICNSGDEGATRVIDGILVSSNTDTVCDASTTSTTRNPNFVEAIDSQSILGAIDCTIDRELGGVSVSYIPGSFLDGEGFDVSWEISLAPGQQSSYTPLTSGNPQLRNISLIVRGEIPEGFANAGTFFGGSLDTGIRVSCPTTQHLASPRSTPLTVTISYTNAFGGQTINAEDGGDYRLFGITGNYRLRAESSGTVTFNPVQPTGGFEPQNVPLSHSVSASGTNTTTTTINFDVSRTFRDTDPDGENEREEREQ